MLINLKFETWLFRMILGEDVDNATIEGSTIRIYPDLTSMSDLRTFAFSRR